MRATPRCTNLNFLPENSRLSQMTLDVLTPGSMDQYVKEERSLLAKRATSENKRLLALMDCMREDCISKSENILRTPDRPVRPDSGYCTSKRRETWAISCRRHWILSRATTKAKIHSSTQVPKIVGRTASVKVMSKFFC